MCSWPCMATMSVTVTVAVMMSVRMMVVVATCTKRGGYLDTRIVLQLLSPADVL